MDPDLRMFRLTENGKKFARGLSPNNRNKLMDFFYDNNYRASLTSVSHFLGVRPGSALMEIKKFKGMIEEEAVV